MRISRMQRTAAALATTALLLTGCRVPFSAEAKFLDQSALAIAEAAFEEMRGLESVRLLGSMDFDDRHGVTRMDMQFDDRGNCHGSFDTEIGEFEARQNKRGFWSRGDERFLRSVSDSTAHGDAMLEAFGRKWMTSTEDAEAEAVCDFKKFRKAFKVNKSESGESLTKGEVEAIGEEETVPINGTVKGEPYTFWVAVSAPHWILKMAPTDDINGQETLYFNDFDAEFLVETPAKKDVVDVSKL